MKLILLIAAAAIGVATAAGADPLAATYGNTVTQTLPDGTKAIVYINADKTWEQHVTDEVVKGTYAWKDDTHVCFTVTDPAPQDPSTATSCIEIKGERNVGDSWTEAIGDGKAITISITAGR